jgi:ribosomal protein S18 acetylase RimI-like enzyme
MESDFSPVIRIAKLEDLETINKYWWDLITEQNNFDDRIVDTEINKHRSMNFLRERIVQGGMYVAENMRSEIIGLGSIAQDLHFLQSQINVWNLADIWVRPEYRRGGIASKIVIHLENIAFEKGAEEVRLNVYSDNISANKLYSSLGYSSKINIFSKSFTN